MTKGVLIVAKLIDVVNASGKRAKVTQKAFDLVYKGQGFKLHKESKKKADDKKDDE